MKINSGNVLVLVLTIFALGSLAVASGYFYLQTKKQDILNTNQSLPPKTESFSCNVDSDCTIGIHIQTNKCCFCPQAINSKFVGKDNWEIYVKGKNYAPNTEECHRVDCSPCEPLGFNSPICSAKKCIQGTNLPVETEKFCGGFAGKICPAGYKCQYEENYPDAGGKCIKDGEVNFTCPENGWLDCMPGLGGEKGQQCANVDWFKANCPNFQGVAQ